MQASAGNPTELELPEPPSTGALVLGVFLLSLGLLAALGFWRGLPLPRVHDEFAYLLTADTFAAGRLTNPTHPHWEHFDTYHVFHEPTYQAKYPPGQGGFLALGQVLLEHPVWGVWLGLAAAMAALTWMLAAVVSPGWAVLGPLLWLANGLLLQKWGMSYWGGGAALLGGALFLGGLLRCLRGASAAAWPAGLGVFLLANTRPAEGALLCLLSLPLWWRCVARERSVLLPLGVALATTLGFTAFYNHALTGQALLPPYLHWDKYVSPHDVIQHYAGSEDPSVARKALRVARFFFGDALLFLLPVLLVRPSRRVLWSALGFAAVAVVSVVATRAWPHYLAPVAPLALLLVVEGLRRVAGCCAAGKWGAALLVLVHLSLGARELARPGGHSTWVRRRQAIAEELVAQGGQHVVFVSYGPQHSVHEEWIYNGADIDAAAVVWARDLGDGGNEGLCGHYRQRRWWRVEVGSGGEASLVPYFADRGAEH